MRLARTQKLLLRPQHRIDTVRNIGHLPAPALDNAYQLVALRAAGRDDTCQVSQARAHDGLQSIQSGLLAGILGREPPDFCECCFGSLHSGTVNFEIFDMAAEHISTLAAFRMPKIPEKFMQFALNLQSVGDTCGVTFRRIHQPDGHARDSDKNAEADQQENRQCSKARLVANRRCVQNLAQCSPD